MDEAQAKMKALREQNNLLLRASALGLLDDIKALVDMGADLDCQVRFARRVATHACLCLYIIIGSACQCATDTKGDIGVI